MAGRSQPEEVDGPNNLLRLKGIGLCTQRQYSREESLRDGVQVIDKSTRTSSEVLSTDDL